eukprot:EG_transcript_5518
MPVPPTPTSQRQRSYLSVEGGMEVKSTVSEGELNNLGLACPICLNFLCDAISLSCGHSFCRLCLLQTTRLSPDGRNCPLCRLPVALPDPYTCHGDDALNRRVQALVSNEEYARRSRSIDVALQELQKTEMHSLPVFYMGPGCTVGERVTLRLLETQYQLLISRAVEGRRMFLYGDGIPGPSKYAVVVQIVDARNTPEGRSVVGVGVERVMMTNVWTDENAKGLFYAQCACRAALGPARELPPPPIVPALDLLPVFYRSSGTGVGRLVALRLCQPRYIFMVRYIMGASGPERFLYARSDPTNGLSAVMVAVQRIRWKHNEEQYIYLEGKGVQEGALQDVQVVAGTEGLFFARWQGNPMIPVGPSQSGCLGKCCVS